MMLSRRTARRAVAGGLVNFEGLIRDKPAENTRRAGVEPVVVVFAVLLTAVSAIIARTQKFTELRRDRRPASEFVIRATRFCGPTAAPGSSRANPRSLSWLSYAPSEKFKGALIATCCMSRPHRQPHVGPTSPCDAP